MSWTQPQAHSEVQAPRAATAAGETRIRVFVVHDHPMYRFGVLSVLGSAPSLLCAGQAEGLEEALRVAPSAAPDVLLMDHQAPGANDPQLLEQLRNVLPLARLVVLSDGADAPLPPSMAAAGSFTVLERGAGPGDLVRALQDTPRRGDPAAVAAVAAETAAAASRGVPAPRAAPELGADLTQRERGLLGLMARGMSNREICDAMGIAMPTVKFHVTNILAKLQVENRTSAVLVALRQKIVTLDA